MVEVVVAPALLRIVPRHCRIDRVRWGTDLGLVVVVVVVVVALVEGFVIVSVMVTMTMTMVVW